MRRTPEFFCKNYFELTQKNIANNFFLKNMMKNGELTTEQLKYLRNQRAFFYKHCAGENVGEDSIDPCFENEIEKRLRARSYSSRH